jgi:hypothetical protein
LADRHGNPTLNFRAPGELWADDYDVLLRLRTPEWQITKSAQLQPPDGTSRRFIGSWGFTPTRDRCLVSRPFSGDAVLLDAETFEVTHAALLEAQPLEASLLADATIYARDWKTGRALRGKMRTI